ncbi:HAD family hydrolase [Candidatus Bathyarchaeota archaeon]|nr:HAD family hydrolase [Candidatus Bathyarchaeota archaeon]
MIISAVVFDLDGTLAEFNLDVMAVRAEVRDFLLKQGLPLSILSLKESIFEMLKRTKLYMKNIGKTDDEYSSIQKKALSIARIHELKAARETSLLPGVLETVKALKKRNLKLAVFTINCKDSAEHILRSFRLKQFFDAVVSREDVLDVKPNPAHLNTALNALSVIGDETVVVGDSVADMRTAKDLNVKAIGLASDDEAAARLTSAGASYIIKSITDLTSIIRELSN